MPTKWTGTFEERLARLEESGRRCDANSRHCTRSAVDKYVLIRADGKGVAVPGAQPEPKKSCGYHRQQFIDSGMWIVVEAGPMFKKMPTRPPRRAQDRDSRQ